MGPECEHEGSTQQRHVISAGTTQRPVGAEWGRAGLMDAGPALLWEVNSNGIRGYRPVYFTRYYIRITRSEVDYGTFFYLRDWATGLVFSHLASVSVHFLRFPEKYWLSTIFAIFFFSESVTPKPPMHKCNDTSIDLLMDAHGCEWFPSCGLFHLI